MLHASLFGVGRFSFIGRLPLNQVKRGDQLINGSIAMYLMLSVYFLLPIYYSLPNSLTKL